MCDLAAPSMRLDSEEDDMCRICWSSATDTPPRAPELKCLISPCACKGSQQFVHPGCLEEWRRRSQHSAFRCPVCLEVYTVPLRAPCASWGSVQAFGEFCLLCTLALAHGQRLVNGGLAAACWTTIMLITFDVERPARGHVGYGYAAIGAGVAQASLEEMLETGVDLAPLLLVLGGMAIFLQHLCAGLVAVARLVGHAEILPLAVGGSCIAVALSRTPRDDLANAALALAPGTLMLFGVDLLGGVRGAEPVPALRPGLLLVATEAIPEASIFGRSVVLITCTGPEGTEGLIINALGPEHARGVAGDGFRGLVAMGSAEVHGIRTGIGGPVSQRSLCILHELAPGMALPEDSVQIIPGVALRTRRLPRLPPQGTSAFYLLGRAGWGPNQLDTELRRGAWHLCDASRELVFGPAGNAALWDQLAADAERRIPLDAPHARPPAAAAAAGGEVLEMDT